MAVAINTSGIHHMALRCTDLARSRQFYAETLEFPVVLEGPEIFLFLAGATAIAVRACQGDMVETHAKRTERHPEVSRVVG